MSPLIVIFATVFIDLIGFGVIIPLLPFYAERFQATPDEVALLMAVFSLTQFLFAPVWGALSDRLGRKPILLASLFGIALSYVWIGFSGTLWELFAARAAAGAMAGNIAAAQAYIADVTPPEKRAKGMGVIGAAFGLGFTLGPAIGGLLGGGDPSNPNFVLPALTSAALSLAALVFAVFFLKESLPREARGARRQVRQGRLSRLATALATPELVRLIIIFFLVTFVFAGMESTFALWSERSFGWGPAQNGYIFAFTGLFAAAVQGGLIGRLSQRFGEARLVTQGALCLGLGLAAIPLAQSLPLLIAAMALLAFGVGVNNPSLASLISQHGTHSNRGQVMGVSQSAASLARILGPAAAGLLFADLGRDWPYLAGAAVMVAVLLLSLRIARAPQAVPEEA